MLIKHFYIFSGIPVIMLFIACNNKIITNQHKQETIVEKHGLLQVKGTHIVDKNNEAVSLAGNSFFWSNPSWGGAKFYNKDIVKWLVKDWNTQIIRLPLAADTEVKDGYLYEPEVNQQAVERLVNAAINEGIYVIIDWHSHHAEQTEKQAIDFFKKMAEKYGKYPNVIYEIYNEPLKVSWDSVVKPYAERVIKAIRQIDPDNLIIIGTPNWSIDIDLVSHNPISDPNLAYTFHFYAGTNFEWKSGKMKKAIQNGTPLFVTEWGTVNSDGDGKVHTESVIRWMKLLKKYKLSHCNWSVNDKTEGASILKPGADIKGGWTDDDLTPSGKLVKKYIRHWQEIIREP